VAYTGAPAACATTARQSSQRDWRGAAQIPAAAGRTWDVYLGAVPPGARLQRTPAGRSIAWAMHPRTTQHTSTRRACCRHHGSRHIPPCNLPLLPSNTGFATPHATPSTNTPPALPRLARPPSRCTHATYALHFYAGFCIHATADIPRFARFWTRHARCVRAGPGLGWPPSLPSNTTPVPRCCLLDFAALPCLHSPLATSPHYRSRFAQFTILPRCLQNAYH